MWLACQCRIKSVSFIYQSVTSLCDWHGLHLCLHASVKLILCHSCANVSFTCTTDMLVWNLCCMMCHCIKNWCHLCSSERLLTCAMTVPMCVCAAASNVSIITRADLLTLWQVITSLVWASIRFYDLLMGNKGWIRVCKPLRKQKSHYSPGNQLG